MREVIAICRSSKRSRVRVAAVLDRYFWRIGSRTWRGRASNACLDRVARELRAEAKRNTAVAIHEIRSARESRVPIVRIGSRRAFSAEGLAPVASHPARSPRWPPRPERERHLLAIACLAVLFHDLGKATRLFQNKLCRSLRKREKPEADAVRHELGSAVVWDLLVGGLDDMALIQRLRALTSAEIDASCKEMVDRLGQMRAKPREPMPLAFAAHEGTIAHAVGMLVLTHHHLPEGSSNHLHLLAERHVKRDVLLREEDLCVASGAPFWHDARWLSRLRRATDDLAVGAGAPGLDMALRVALMLADHLGSALKEPRDRSEGHLGNTCDGRPADPLDLHVRRVLERLPGTFDMLHRHRERYPALGADQVPLDLLHPQPTPGPFAWQAVAAAAARDLCAAREGGFFACLVAGTGTGKTRGAPTVLAAAAFADLVPERRYLRVTLALGLRALASQSAQTYVEDLGFRPEDVAVLIGQPPVRFGDEAEEKPDDGSESLVALPAWLRLERATGGVPHEGSEREADWLRGLSHDTDRGLPATLDLYIEKAGARHGSARLLAAAPVLVGTVDHLMGVATPTKASRFPLQAVRALSADLILDEIDQYNPEDIAAIGRLVYQAAAGGRRVVVMSATLTSDVASAYYEAYCAGWRVHAAASGVAEHVNALVSGDAADSCATNAGGGAFGAVYEACRTATLAALASGLVRRRGRILQPCNRWAELVAQVDGACEELHNATASNIEGLNVSIGFVRMTRIAHAAALAVQLPAGPRAGRLRLKLCVHSQFPRLHRDWIERELSRALTRKGADPEAGLRPFCERHGLIERARAEGCSELQIVVVTSPVIETGNDLDFDWAILDPGSMRAVVQAAGRVWRHRIYDRADPNVLILGRSAIVMETRLLARPGVETEPHKDTLVEQVSLDRFGERLFADLAGTEAFERIDACAVLRDGGGVPLRAAEARLRAEMVRTGPDAPLGLYLRRSTARLNLTMTRSRMFRRSTVRDVLYFQDGDAVEKAAWYVDLAPGTRQSTLRPASGLHLAAAHETHLVFPDLAGAAWSDYRSGEDEVTAAELRRLMRVQVPDYDRAEAEPTMTYGEWTGFTRGKPDDLSGPFGKVQKEQGLD